MGINFTDYLQEAYRCLKLDEHLWIAEPSSRLQDQALFLELLKRLGFDIRSIQIKGKFTFIEALKDDKDINEQGNSCITNKSRLICFTLDHEIAVLG